MKACYKKEIAEKFLVNAWTVDGKKNNKKKKPVSAGEEMKLMTSQSKCMGGTVTKIAIER